MAHTQPLRTNNHTLLWCLTLISLFLNTIITSSEEIQSVEIATDGEAKVTTEEPPPRHPNALEVIFENQSGQKVEIYWDDSKEGVLQNSLGHTSQITINTFLGHRFYFTPAESTGDKKQKLYEITMEEHTGLVTLYDPDTMSERDAAFEKKKSEAMKQYYQKTGRRWQNYYPREPVTHFYYDVEQKGQQFVRTSERTQFNICTVEQLTNVIENELNALESEWMEKQPEKTQECIDEPEAEGCKKLPASFQTENDDFFIGKMNGTVYCRSKTENISITIVNVCNSGPHAFRIFNFLSDDELDHIRILGQFMGLKRSTVSEEALETLDRTSQTVWIERSKSFIVDNIIRRIADAVQINETLLFLNSSSESLQLVHYFGGELYKSHVDYGTDQPHNRYITFLMYLNDVNEGGFTSFPKAHEDCQDENNYFGIEPVKGSVAFFYNLFPDGNVDVRTQHYAEPPVESEKWMTNLWIWDKVFSR